MNDLPSTKMRAIGSASAIALTAGLGTAASSQEMDLTAPDSVESIPTPMAPVAPADAVECALDATANTVVCAPGLDADGFASTDDDLGLDVQEGAFVQSTISLTGANATGVINGDVVSDGGLAVDLGEGASIVNNGFLSNTTSAVAGLLRTGDGSTIENNGVITSTQSNQGGIETGSNTTVTNNGDVIISGPGTIGITGTGSNSAFGSDTGVTIANSVTGRIIVGNGSLSAIFLGDEGTVTNDGLVQLFDGNFANTIRVGDDSAVTNTGNIVATGTNTTGVAVGANSTVENNGLIQVTGDDSLGIFGADGVTVVNTGTITAMGDGARGVDAGDDFTLTNSGTIEAQDRALNLGDGATITNEVGGLINSTGDGDDTTEDADTIQAGDNLTVVNNGTISNEGFDTKIIDAGDGLTVTNNGTITSQWKGVEGEANFTLTNNAGGLIFSEFDEAVEADDAGLVVVNDGEIIAPKDDAVDGGADVNITNTGLIQGGENDGLELDSGTITNSGIIESLSSDPEGDFSDAGLINRELDAGIDFDGVDDPENLAGPEFDTVTNLAGGIIRGDIGINASSGNFVDDGEGGSEAGSPANVRSQTIVNFGLIQANAGNPVNGGRLDAVLLGLGDDEFQQWTGAEVIGWVDLEGGNDTFILEGTSSSITGFVDGGEGNDLAILAGTFNSDNIIGFETVQLGSDLGGTLNDVRIAGNRTITGDVVAVGEVSLELGVDSLTTDGSITLEETSTINIATPLDEELLGETVLIFQEGTEFEDEGATINIIDDDLLLDYTPVDGSLAVQVTSVNPLIGNPDTNLGQIGGAVNSALNSGTLSAGNFDALNALPHADAYAEALADALPSLSDGVAREIFESGSLASSSLDRHLKAEGTGVWGQFAVRGANQDAISQSVDGYDSDQTVFTIGGDVMLGDAVRVGLMASYADINVQDETATGRQTNDQDVESIRLGFYMSTTLFDRGFVNSEFSYITGEVDTARSGLLGVVSSSYDFDGFASRTVFGYDLLADENISLTPKVGVNAMEINFDDALEAGGFAFTVEQGDARFVEARFGAELGAQISEKVSGFVQGTVVHDLIDTQRSLRLSSSELPTFSIAQPVRERDRFELAAGASIDVTDRFAIELGYLGDFNEGYQGHSGRASVRIAF